MTKQKHSASCLSAGGGPSDDDCICGADKLNVVPEQHKIVVDALTNAFGTPTTSKTANRIQYVWFERATASIGIDVMCADAYFHTNGIVTISVHHSQMPGVEISGTDFNEIHAKLVAWVDQVKKHHSDVARKINILGIMNASLAALQINPENKVTAPKKKAYEGKQLKVFMRFARQKFMSDMRACLVAQSINADVSVLESQQNSVERLTILVEPKRKRGKEVPPNEKFSLEINTDGNGFNSIFYSGPRPEFPEYFDEGQSKSKKGTVDSIQGLVYGNLAKNKVAAAAYSKAVQKNAEFDSSIMEALVAFEVSVKTIFAEFERTQ